MLNSNVSGNELAEKTESVGKGELFHQKPFTEKLNDPHAIRMNDWADSMKYASWVQRGILPKERHFNRLFEDSFFYYQPKDLVSGDFYWVGASDEVTYVAVGDCTGHGVAGAMLSVLSYSLLEYVVMRKKIRKTNKILMELDKRFMDSFSAAEEENTFNNDWVDISLCGIERKTNTIYFSGAHRKILLVSDKEMKIYSGSPYPVGGWQLEKNRNYRAVTIPYSKGDVLYLGSDGFQDQFGGILNKKYKSQKLHQLLCGSRNLPMKELRNILEQEFHKWKGDNEQTDDITIVGIRL